MSTPVYSMLLYQHSNPAQDHNSSFISITRYISFNSLCFVSTSKFGIRLHFIIYISPIMFSHKIIILIIHSFIVLIPSTSLLYQQYYSTLYSVLLKQHWNLYIIILHHSYLIYISIYIYIYIFHSNLHEIITHRSCVECNKFTQTRFDKFQKTIIIHHIYSQSTKSDLF
jgi:hypothetical protein